MRSSGNKKSNSSETGSFFCSVGPKIMWSLRTLHGPWLPKLQEGWLNRTQTYHGNRPIKKYGQRLTDSQLLYMKSKPLTRNVVLQLLTGSQSPGKGYIHDQLGKGGIACINSITFPPLPAFNWKCWGEKMYSLLILLALNWLKSMVHRPSPIVQGLEVYCSKQARPSTSRTSSTSWHGKASFQGLAHEQNHWTRTEISKQTS